MDLQELAQALFETRLSRPDSKRLLDEAPALSHNDALTLQIATKKLQAAAGDRIVGYQASFTSEAAQRMAPGMPVPMVGTLMASMVRDSGGTCPRSVGPMLVECEIAVLLERDLEGPDVTFPEALGAVRAYLPVVELTPLEPEQIKGGWSDHAIIAMQKPSDGMIFCGRRLVPPFEFDASNEGVSLSADGIVVQSAVGHQSMGNPIAALVGVARGLHGIGERLRAGQMVMTGSITPPHVLASHERALFATFTNLGSVSLQIS